MSNHRRMSSGISTIFSFDARASCKCFALTDLTVTVNPLSFLSLLVILQLVSREYIYTLSNRSVAKCYGYNNLLRRAFASGKVRAAANDNRRCKSVISAAQWEADTQALFGVGWEWMLIYVRDRSDMVGRHHAGIDLFGGRLVNTARI